jgi:hypothetical protein
MALKAALFQDCFKYDGDGKITFYRQWTGDQIDSKVGEAIDKLKS